MASVHHANDAMELGQEPLGPARSSCVISAMTETAISAGDWAPMSRPTGAWIRSVSAGLKPASASRERRAACVLLLPRLPM